MEIEEEALREALKTNLDLTKKLSANLKTYWILNIISVYIFVIVSIIFLRIMGLI